jgi:hypothetical protein
VQASDGQGGIATQDFTIAVTNASPSTPTDSDSAPNTVVEGATNGTAVRITASAIDVNGPNVAFSLTSDAGGRFAIDTTTGVVTVADETLLDFETATSHTITVQASDGKGGTATQDFTIAVTNAIPSTPTDSDNTANSVVEGALSGTPVGITASASDVNGPSVTYSLSNDAGGRFAIDATTGMVTVADGTLLDYETAPSHTITVQASDGQGGTSTASFDISVNNVAPTLAISGKASLNEGDTYTLNLSASDPGTDTISHWDINWGDGNVEVVSGNPTSVRHTYADNGSYTISATATDEHDTYAAGNTVGVTVNNVAPTAVGVMGPAFLGLSTAGHFFLNGVFDPSSVDISSLHYSFATSLGDLATSSATAGTANSFDLSSATLGTYTIYGRVFDKDGASTTYSTTVIVNAGQKFDLKASVSAPTVEGWKKAWQGTKYSSTTGYGWSRTSSVGGGTGGLVPSGENTAVYGDYAYGVTTATFQVFVGANRFATVKIYSYGTASQGKPGVAAKIGNGPTSTLTTNGVLTVSGQAGADGILNITFSRGTGKAMWIVSAMEVTPASIETKPHPCDRRV